MQEAIQFSNIVLPGNFQQTELLAQDLVINDTTIHLYGVCAANDEPLQAVGSAATLDESGRERAYYEMLERSATIAAYQSEGRTFSARTLNGDVVGIYPKSLVFPTDANPERLRNSISNGVALGNTWEHACMSSFFETIERDRILRSWAHDLPMRVVSTPESLANCFGKTHELICLEVGEPVEVDFLDSTVHTVAIVGFPHDPAHPLILSYAARANLDLAVEKAAQEALQTTAFLWEETWSEQEAQPHPAASYHQAFYQLARNHSILRQWLSHATRDRPRHCTTQLKRGGDSWFDLSPAQGFGGLKVAKYYNKELLVLSFGENPELCRLTPSGLAPHPIP